MSPSSLPIGLPRRPRDSEPLAHPLGSLTARCITRQQMLTRNDAQVHLVARMTEPPLDEFAR
jgi:hypothetical protein